MNTNLFIKDINHLSDIDGDSEEELSRGYETMSEDRWNKKVSVWIAKEGAKEGGFTTDKIFCMTTGFGDFNETGLDILGWNSLTNNKVTSKDIDAVMKGFAETTNFIILPVY